MMQGLVLPQTSSALLSIILLSMRLRLVTRWKVAITFFLFARTAGAVEASTTTTLATDDDTQIQIAGFWPDYRSLDNLNQSAPLLSDLILFSLELDENGRVGHGCCLRPEHYERARTAKDNFAPNMNLWITIGGAGRTNHWKEVCSDPNKRARFIDSVVDLCRRQQIQGVSVDWFSAMSTSHDIQVFSACLQQASLAWRTKPHSLQISLSYYPMQTHPNVFQWVDRIQVMTYGLSSLPSPSSQLSLPDLVTAHLQQVIEALRHADCPLEKIWLGVPFYAQAIRKDTQRLNPILTFSDAMTSTDKSMQNTDIQNHLHKVFDGYQWESLEIMKVKTDLVRMYSLGGLFVWELGQDATTQAVPSGVALTQLSQLAGFATTEPPLQPIYSTDNGEL